MNTVVLHVETELDPSAAPRVFGYLGGLGHIPMRAALRREGAEALVMEVHFESPLPMAQLISAKVEQMPFVLHSSLSGGLQGEGSEQAPGAAPGGGLQNVTEGMQHAPSRCTARPHIDAAALRFAAVQRSHAIHHRARVQFNA